MYKRLLSLSSIALLSVALFVSCNGDEVDPCNCPENAPFSVPGSTNCYVSALDCELAEGQICEICIN